MKLPRLNNFTPRAREVIKYAEQYARKMKHGVVEPIHLLYGMLELKHGVHWAVLERLKSDTDSLLREVKLQTEILKPKSSGKGTIEYSKDFIDCISTMSRFYAQRLNHSYVGTEHFLLALIETGKEAGTILENHGLDLAKVEGAINEELDPLNAFNSYPPLRLFVDPGQAPDEVIAEILSDLSLLYRLKGGSGITFELENVHLLAEGGE